MLGAEILNISLLDYKAAEIFELLVNEELPKIQMDDANYAWLDKFSKLKHMEQTVIHCIKCQM